jgi:hypothetical protein
MNYFCLDTCTWIYLANGTEPVKFLEDLLDEINSGNLVIILPKIVLEEWNKNKADGNIMDGVKRTFININKSIKEISVIIDKIDYTSKFLRLINDEEDNLKNNLDEAVKGLEKTKVDINSKIEENIYRIERIFSHHQTIVVDTPNEVMLTAGKMAIEKKAPLHKKNGFADALIVLTFLDYLDKNQRDEDVSVFISYNKEDFCELGGTKKEDNKTLHPDLTPLFEKYKCNFHPILASALKELDHTLVDDETLREIEEFNNSSDYICQECNGYHGYGNEVYFGDSIDIENENRYRFDDDYPSLPFEELPPIERGSLTTNLQVGYCNHCSTQYIKCQNCGDIIKVVDDYDYHIDNTLICSCGLKYRWETFYDKETGDEVYWKILDDRTEVCEGCGEEFIDKMGTVMCLNCEKEYNDK